MVGNFQHANSNALGYAFLTAAAFSDTETLEILKQIKWATGNVAQFINNRSCLWWTIRKTVTKRRLGEAPHALKLEPDKDPERAYQSLMDLMQKVIDDHYGFEEHHNNNFNGNFRRRMVLVPRQGDERYWDIVEESTTVDRDTARTESDDEVWEDAQELAIGRHETQ
ncbi:MAG: hypothetical protein Q9218_008024 [Villophora microphyllina]